MKTVTFQSDKVKVKTGKADNSGSVEFSVGEYALKDIKELTDVIDCVMKVTVEIEAQ